MTLTSTVEFLTIMGIADTIISLKGKYLGWDYELTALDIHRGEPQLESRYWASVSNSRSEFEIVQPSLALAIDKITYFAETHPKGELDTTEGYCEFSKVVRSDE